MVNNGVSGLRRPRGAQTEQSTADSIFPLLLDLDTCHWELFEAGVSLFDKLQKGDTHLLA